MFFSQFIPFLIVYWVLTPHVFTGFFKHPISSFFERFFYFSWNIILRTYIRFIFFCFFFDSHNYFFLFGL